MSIKMKARPRIKGELDKVEEKCDFSLHRVSRFIQPSILLFLSKKASYGYELIEKLKVLGFHEESIDVGAVYRTLRKLEKEGFLKSFWQEKEGRKKRVYEITPKGRDLLIAWIKRVEERKKALEKFIEFYRGGK